VNVDVIVFVDVDGDGGVNVADPALTPSPQILLIF